MSDKQQRCKYCKEVLHEGARVCYQCGRDQRKWINTLQYLATTTAFAMVLIVIIQLLISGKQIRLSEDQNRLSEEQYKESKLKRIEAEDVLRKAELNSRLAFTISSTNFHKARLATQVTNRLVSESNLKISRAGVDIEALRTRTVTELEVLKSRNKLTMLADRVITSGDRKTFLELYHYANNSSDMAGTAEVLRVKGFYLETDRIGKADINAKTELGLIKDVSTESIIASINVAKNWEFRGRCVKILALRKEKKSAEALLDVIIHDENLAVMKAAIDSFSALTGYEAFDVFDNLPNPRAPQWWKTNKDILADLK